MKPMADDYSWPQLIGMMLLCIVLEVFCWCWLVFLFLCKIAIYVGIFALLVWFYHS